MRKQFLLAIALRATLVLPLAVTAATPKLPLHAASQGNLLDYYDRIPGKHFAGFGGVNRRSLLKRRGAIVDYKRKFIEIPGSASPRDGDLQKLQISLFPNGREPWIAVSRIVWDQDRTPGTLNFYYGYNDAGGLRKASDDLFPHKLKKHEQGYENAYLPRSGLSIEIGFSYLRARTKRFTYQTKRRKFADPFFVQSR